jgi:hypothetical protein
MPGVDRDTEANRIVTGLQLMHMGALHHAYVRELVSPRPHGPTPWWWLASDETWDELGYDMPANEYRLGRDVLNTV